MKPAVKLKNLSISFGPNKVIEDANLTINQGELVFVIGGNGSGKSSLIKAILGLIKYDKGEIEIFEETSNHELISANFGYVPQTTNIDRTFPISVEEIIELECSLAACAVDTKHHLADFNAQYLLNRKIDNLSGGEFQKVLITRALVTHPKILVMDEPTNNLDSDSIKRFKKIIKQYIKAGTTVIIVSHDDDVISEASSEGEVRVVKIENSKVVEILNTKYPSTSSGQA